MHEIKQKSISNQIEMNGIKRKANINHVEIDECEIEKELLSSDGRTVFELLDDNIDYNTYNNKKQKTYLN